MDVRSKLHTGPNGRKVSGVDLLRDPALNKGTAFTQAERDALGLNGLLPPRVHTMEEQVQRELLRVRKQPDDLARYVHLAALRDRNETLFYRLVMDAMDEMMPIIYTPTVGEACQLYARIFQSARGLHADSEGIFRPYSDAERALVQAQLQAGYDRFVSVVQSGRHLTRAQVEAAAGGRVFAGGRAVAARLCDELGGLNAAVAEARRRARAMSAWTCPWPCPRFLR